MAWYNDSKQAIKDGLSDIKAGTSDSRIGNAVGNAWGGTKEMAHDATAGRVKSFMNAVKKRPLVAGFFGVLAGGVLASKFIMPKASGPNDISAASQLGADAANRDFARDMAAMQQQAAQAQSLGGGYTDVSESTPAANSGIDVPTSLMAADTALYHGSIAASQGKTLH